MRLSARENGANSHQVKVLSCILLHMNVHHPDVRLLYVHYGVSSLAWESVYV